MKRAAHITARDRLALRARLLVAKAIKAGTIKLLKGQYCADCGAAAEAYDHRDYNKPYDVEPVCQACNNRRGPGLPFPVEADGQTTKNGFVEHVGKLWGILESGEGYEPLHAKLHVEFDTSSNFDHDIVGMPSAGRGLPPSLKAPTWKARADYFKRRDPWYSP